MLIFVLNRRNGFLRTAKKVVTDIIKNKFLQFTALP